MWVALNNAFLSIVQPKQQDYRRWRDQVDCGKIAHELPNDAKFMLSVRSRSAADLRKALPKVLHAGIVEWPGRDYPARVMLPRDTVANLIASSVRGIGYTNFKDSVKAHPLHDAYMAVWSIMNRYGKGDYSRSGKAKGGQKGFDWRDGAGGAENGSEGPYYGPMADRYGDFDDRDDIDAQSSLRHPPA